MKSPLALAAVLLLLAAASAAATIYRYEDKEGEIHFTDSLESVPAEYQSQIERVDRAPVPGGFEGHKAQPPPAQAAPAAPVEPGDVPGQLIREINEQSAKLGQPPLSQDEQSQLRGIWEKWMIALGAAWLGAFAVWLGLTIHAFSTGHPGWAVAVFLLGLPAPFYAIKHVGEDRRWLKVILPVLFLLPMALSAGMGVELYQWMDAVGGARGGGM